MNLPSPEFIAALQQAGRKAQQMSWQCFDCSRIYSKVRQRRVAAKCPDCGSNRERWYCLDWFIAKDGQAYVTDARREMAYVREMLG